MDATADTIESFVNSEYKYGFVSDIETEAFAPGLSEDTVQRISDIKGEPAFMREWRLKAFRHWTTMTEPHWPNVHYPPIDYQAYIYYAAAKEKKKLGSLDEV
ncbi:MAG: Fe-S cluster assembly protein SufB, partial [Verrucomicrobiota bacterium]